MRERSWRPFSTSCREPVAQLVEHRPFKARVPGSSPGRLTRYNDLHGVVRGACTLLSVDHLSINRLFSYSELLNREPTCESWPDWSI